MATLGSVTVHLPLGYMHEPIKLETMERSINGSLIVNYAVNSENTAVTKYRFELQGVTRSQRMDVRAEALKTGNMYFIDDIRIPEVFSYTTDSIQLQRQLGSSDSADVTFYLDGTTQSVSVYTTSAPTTGAVSITSTGGILFGTVGTTAANNVIVYYVPKYSVHIMDDRHQLLWEASSTDHIVRYNISLEEA